MENMSKRMVLHRIWRAWHSQKNLCDRRILSSAANQRTMKQFTIMATILRGMEKEHKHTVRAKAWLFTRTTLKSFIELANNQIKIYLWSHLPARGNLSCIIEPPLPKALLDVKTKWPKLWATVLTTSMIDWAHGSCWEQAGTPASWIKLTQNTQRPSRHRWTTPCTQNDKAHLEVKVVANIISKGNFPDTKKPNQAKKPSSSNISSSDKKSNKRLRKPIQC